MTENVNQETGAAPEAVADPRAASEATTAGGDQAASAGDAGTLEERVARAEEQAQEAQDRYLRARADMENFKKRIERTYSDRAESSKKELLRKLLAVKDNLERALHYGESGIASGEGLMEGVRLTQYQLDQLLDQEGVKVIEADGQPFDPRLEEAVQSVQNASVPDHTVVQVVRRGYTYHDSVLRPAQVIVSVQSGDAEES
jgi:molecular chaperone GrpE